MEAHDRELMMTMKKKAEIDTSAPFRSVKEAVMLFGEKVLAGEVYSSKFREEQMEQDEESENDELASSSRIETITVELEETKQSLVKAREESMVMANSLSYLQQELEKTRRELQEIKKLGSKSYQKQVKNINEDLKFIELDHSSPEFEVNTKTINKKAEFLPSSDGIQCINAEEKMEYQKKRYVTFADSPTNFSQVLVPTIDHEEAVLQRHPSLRKSRRKPLIPLIKGILRKRIGIGIGSQAEVASQGKV